MVAKKKAKASAKKAGTAKSAAEARRKLFVEAYIANGGNATEAAKTAGFSAKTADQQGSRLLKDVKVLAEINSRQAELAKKYELTTDDVIRSLARAVHFDPRKLYHPDGRLKSVHELDDDTADALTALEVVAVEGKDGDENPLYTKKYRWLDKNTARDQVMKHLGMFKEDNKQRNGLLGELPRELVQAIVERLRGSGGR